MSNRNLTIIFVVLMALFAASKLFKKDTGSSFEKVAIKVDTAQVNKLVFYPKNNEASFSAIRTDNGWNVTKNEITSRASENIIRSILGTLSRIEIQRIVAKSEDKWEDYEVGADSGFRLVAYNGNEIIEDIYIGRFNFNQQTRSATSYLRKNGQEDTYALDGFLSMSLNQSFDGLRDKTILKLDKSAVTAISLNHRDISAMLSKTGNQWFTGNGLQVDSVQMAQYLNSLGNVQGNSIVDGLIPSDLIELGTLIFNYDSGRTISINSFEQENKFIITSTENRDVYFSSDSSGVYKTVMTDLIDLVNNNIEQ